MIKRDYYLNKLIDYKDKQIVKIITGIRRSGKSYLLFNIYHDYLLSCGIDNEHLIMINLESIRFSSIRNCNDLYNFIDSKILDKEKYYIFIDEIQLIDSFEDLVNGLIIDFNCDLYITGSNSKLLSSEINTKLRGRGIEIKMYPLSFMEFFSISNKSKEEAFKEYIMYGGLPYLVELEKDYEKKEYLSMINQTVVFKDIIDRNGIRNKLLFESVLELLSSQIGGIVSPNNIAKTLKSNNYKTVDNETISNYLKYVTDAFLFYKVYRFDIKGKEYLKTLNKYYSCDLGLRNERIGFKQIEMTHILENIVYLELLRRNFSVSIGKNDNKEIDFVAENSTDRYYIQVSLTIENEDTRKRELNAFIGLDDGYKKIVITMDNNPLINIINGYKMLNIFDFLLNFDSLNNI